jgi:cell division protein FtsI/penicillin-binding protein 2
MFHSPARSGRLLGVLLGLTLVFALAGCTRDPGEPPRGLPPADGVLSELATGLASLTVATAPFAVGSPSPAQDTAEISELMDGLLPEVKAGALTYGEDDQSAVGTLTYAWTLPSGVWEYETTVDLIYDGTIWKGVWKPAVLHPRLDSTNRLVHTREAARRAVIVGHGGQHLVDEITVVHVGIDKMNTPPEQQEASARALAGRVEIDADAYAQQVADSGAQAFVEAMTYRQDEVPDILDIEGARGVKDVALLGPTKGFLQPVIGSVGEAWSEDVEESEGAIGPADQVGHSGLQATFDDQLRGTPGDKVFLAPRGTDEVTAPPPDLILYDQPPVDGQPLQTSFDLDLQLKAEAVMAEVGQAAAAVLIRPSDGAILAAAESPASDGQPDATLNHYAPGSTFKIVTALALLRHGYTSDTPVECSFQADAGGLLMKNYNGYPGGYLGSIPLLTAVAQSCNTAFVNQIGQLAPDDLTKAAASLGAGIDYDAGGLNYGTVPTADSTAMKGQEVIGQGGVLMSPVAMAGVIASVAAGRTVVPWMAASLKPEPEGAPLTPAEAAELQKMLAATVSNGLASNLQGVAVGGKSGTAEYGEGNPLPTHAWMVAYTDRDLAVAVWAHDGGGSGTAGPIIWRLLS